MAAMSISVIGSGPGHLVPGEPNAGGSPPDGRPPVDARVEHAAQVERSEPDRGAEIGRRAWFDLDGDGRIEDWNPLYGGDGVVYARPHASDPDPDARRGRDAPSAEDPPRTPVAVNAARHAYERYGHDAAPPPRPELEHVQA
jgi:hypothetical protein